MITKKAIDTAKEFSCATLLLATYPESFSHRTSSGILYFHSPLHADATASLAVNEKKNVWFDHGDPDMRGDVISLAKNVLKIDFEAAVNLLVQSHNSERLKNIQIPLGPIRDENAGGSKTDNAAGRIAVIKAVPLKDLIPKPDFETNGLLRYLTDVRGIKKATLELDTLRHYLYKINYTTQAAGKQWYSVGFINNMGGYELRSEKFKGCAVIKTYTLIKGTRKGICIFEGFINYLSALQHFKGTTEIEGFDILILNSTSQRKKALPVLLEHSNWMYFGDRDQAGNNLFDWLILNAPEQTEVVDRRDTFAGYIDFNDKITNTTPSKRHWKYDGPLNPRRTTAKYWLWVVWPEVEVTNQGWRDKQRTFYGFTDDQEGLECLKMLANEINGAKIMHLCERVGNEPNKWNVLPWS